MWSVGVIMYAMIFGYLPFHAESKEEMKRKILIGEYRFSRRTSASSEAKSLMKELLSMNPRKRPTVETIKKHDWFKDVQWN